MRRRDFIQDAAFVAAGLMLPGCRLLSERYGEEGESVRREAMKLVADKLFLGIAVGRNDCFKSVYVGRSGLSNDAAAIDELTRFDLASLTKTVTASVCATLVTDGLLDPDAPFTEYYPEHALGKSCEITVRDLATHSSGFGNFSGKRYCEDLARHGGAVGFEQELREKRPERSRGTYCYSCYNYALLGTVAERVGRRRLDQLAAERVFGPLGMTRSCWWPVTDDGHVVEVPLRMKDGKLRKIGEVHDEVARYAGRPIGNAGVFSTLPDMTRFVEDLLERRMFPAAHYDLLFNGTFKQGKVCRSFGFDMGENRPEGFSSAAIHHSGFTGQLLCVDPELSFAGVVLTLRCQGAEGTLAARRRLLSLYSGCQQSTCV